MFPQKISQNIDILAKIHRNAFPWQPAIMGNKASPYYSMFQISLPWLHSFLYNACPRYLKSRQDLLYFIFASPTPNHQVFKRVWQRHFSNVGKPMQLGAPLPPQSKSSLFLITLFTSCRVVNFRP